MRQGQAAALGVGGLGLLVLWLGARSKRARAALEDGAQIQDLGEIGKGIVEEGIDMAKMVSAYFSLAEWTRSDLAQGLGLSNQPNQVELANIERTSEMLDKIRALVGDQVIITSGFRSQAVNSRIGGSTTSQHMTGEAADIKAPSLGTWQATELARRIIDAGIEWDQLIGYPPALGGHVHISLDAAGANRRQVQWSPSKKTYRPWNPHTQPNGEGVVA